MKALWAHQQQVIDLARPLDEFALFHDMGTGKSRSTVEIVREKFVKDGRLLRTLILCPQIVCENWRREWLQYSKIRQEDIVIPIGAGKKRVKTIMETCFKDALPVSNILVLNYEALTTVKGLMDILLLWRPEVVICDESQRIKNHTAKRTQAAVKLGKFARYRYILTGTPVLNNYMDIFSQFLFLDGGKTFGDNFFIFRNMYFEDKNSGMPSHVHFPNWQLKPHVEDDIKNRMFTKAHSVRKSECLDLPPLVHQSISIELDGEQARLYEEMKKNFIAFLNDSSCTAQLAITKGLRLQQIASGFMVTDKEVTISLKDNPRQKALSELLADLTPNHKVIVWACWRENYEQIRKVCEKLCVRYVELHGEIPIGQRTSIQDSFNNDPDVRVLIGNQGAAGIGINLVSSDYMIYYSRNFSLEQDLQSEARNYRGGSEIHEKVTRIDIVAANTIDEKVLESLSKKQEISEKILRQIISENLLQEINKEK
jgi:SNF2 family DNA or RNA helicase